MPDDSTRSPQRQAPSRDGPFGPQEVGFLIDALHDPVQDVRTAALRALVRLPLTGRAWREVGDFIGRALWPAVSADEGLGSDVEPAVPRQELIEAAVYVPDSRMRRGLQRLVEEGSEEDRWTAAHALAKARDPSAIPELLDELSEGEKFGQAEAAAALSLLDVAPVQKQLRQILRTHPDGDVRFWLALALARQGDTESVDRYLKDLQAGRIEGPWYLLMTGQPLSELAAARGPFPAPVQSYLRKAAANRKLDLSVRSLAGDMFAASQSGLAEGPIAAEAPPAPPAGAEAEALRQRAVAVAERYLVESPFSAEGEFPWEEWELMAWLPPDKVMRLVSALFAQLIGVMDQAEGESRAFGYGNDLMNLPARLWQSFEPDLPSLLESYLNLAGRGAAAINQRWQLAWVLSRAGVGRLLAETALRMASADGSERMALARLVEEARQYARYQHGPIFGGGGAPEDVLPATEPYLDEETLMAAPEQGAEEAAERELVEAGERGAEEGLPPTPPAPRWLQAQVFEMREGAGAGETQESQLRKALRAGAEHRLRLWIGPDAGEGIRAQDVFPEERLPPDQERYELQILFWEEKHAPEPQLGTIFLPRGRGRSTPCDFHFQARGDVPDFAGRLVVMHASRILQTMLLVGQVLAEPELAPPEAGIALQRDTPVRATPATLETVHGFEAAVIADTGRDGSVQMASVAGERVELRSLEGVAQTIRFIRGRIEQIADSPEDFGALDSEATVTLLRFLARQGSMLYQGIVETYLPDHPLRTRGQRIQLVSARDSYLPLEFVYDRPSPARDAVLCPHAAQALEAGRCDECDGEEAAVVRQRICPLGFWCTSRVIERHWVEPVEEAELQGADYALEGADPTAERAALHVLSAAVYAASGRVNSQQAEDLHQSLAVLTGGAVRQVQDWSAWCLAVKESDPSILVLLPHTLLDDDSIPTLEIGDRQQLANDEITKDYVRGEAAQPPVVLLLGCQTAVPDLPYQAFATRFRTRGAAIVLSTLAPVLGRHAVPVAKLLVQELQRAAEAGGTFGEAVLAVRRHALAAGLPMVLSLVAAGDADWRLQGG